MSTFNVKMSSFFRSLNCCGGSSADTDDGFDNDRRPALQISSPTNFRREDITIAGLTEEQQRFIREKARSDAERMYLHLSPLASSPSGTFAERPTPMPTYEHFTQPRPAPVPSPPSSPPLSVGKGRASLTVGGEDEGVRRGSLGGMAERVRAHSRKISDAFVGKGGRYQAVGSGERGVGVEMRAQMDGKGKVSVDSLRSDGDSGKAMGGRI